MLHKSGWDMCRQFQFQVHGRDSNYTDEQEGICDDADIGIKNKFNETQVCLLKLILQLIIMVV